jgi:hypothetical protein
MSTSNLRDRCAEILVKNQNMLFPDELHAFVLAEIGRSASNKLEDSSALVLFFETPEGAQEVAAAIQEAMPGLVEKRWP